MHLAARLSLCALLGALLATPSAQADEDLHFLIPAGAGGGLDSTARAVGETLRALDLVDRASFENLSGGGGGRAMGHFIETAPRQHDTLIVNSTPLVIRSLQGLFPHSYRDLTPIAAVIGDYGAFVVRADSPFERWQDVVDHLRDDPRTLAIGGGSVRGSLDHVVLAMALEAAGIEPRAARYLPYDGGGKAMIALLGGEVDLLSTGLGESLTFRRAGDVRVLAITAPAPHPDYPELATLRGAGYDVAIANWRGFFGPPGLPEGIAEKQTVRLDALVETEQWAQTLERNGWVDLYLTGEDFLGFLDEQEARLAQTMKKLGFLRQ